VRVIGYLGHAMQQHVAVAQQDVVMMMVRVAYFPQHFAIPVGFQNCGLLRANLCTENFDGGGKPSLFTVFSPRLWTTLNPYRAGRPIGTRLREWLDEFEERSLGREGYTDSRTSKPVGRRSTG
jgi:hypothetical protein